MPASTPPADKDHISDADSLTAGTVQRIVMAEQITQDVVKEAQSMGDASPIDVSATTTKNTTAGNGETAPLPEPTEPNPSEASDTPNPNSAGTRAAETDQSTQNEDTEGHDSTPAPAVQPPTTETDEAREGLVNGYNEDRLVAEDAAIQQVITDASGGSDTDISRTDSFDETKDAANRHSRTTSVKKPTSFKAVSVTKSFLAKTAGAAPGAKGSEKGSASGQASPQPSQTAKPRLVAKSGSGTSVPRSGLAKLNGNSGGPDASKVWNKNRPIPPPPPRQFTDEELKQQYGIHMATRLQADEAGKESKWADIDDDEDDWAPETVEWMDGTKSSVIPTESQRPPPEPPKAAPSRSEKPPEPAKPILAPVQKPSSTGTAKTILKPGGHSTGTQTKTGGLILKSAPEKPTLVAKPSAPVPVKSPWAPLPPVEKVSPVNPPVQLPAQPRFTQRDPHGFDALPTAPSPAKEIAADDFNRSWREERSNKELFNSQSGRYEPVNEPRRGSARHDQGYRQPAVLQRPPQNNQPGPAEPSPAFQTSRSSGAAEGSWGRRRTLSNVSGGSAPQGRQMSITRPPDLPPTPDEIPPRQGPQTTSDMPNPSLQQRPHHLERGTSPADPNQRPWARPSPTPHQAQPVSSPIQQQNAIVSGNAIVEPPMPIPPMQDPVLLQKQLMSEKLERARQAKLRQQEEEEREEAAKKERLRLKLEALEQISQPQSPSAKEAVLKDEKVAETKDISTTTAKAPIVPSPPKPPVPTAEGEVAQYGMMKVHQPHPVKKAVIPDTFPSDKDQSQSPPESLPRPAPSAHPAISPSKSPDKPVPAISQPRSDGTTSHIQREERARDVGLPTVQQIDRTAQAWKQAAPTDAYSGWPSRGMTTHTAPGGNVWGPPNQDRALGNGTFDNGYNRIPPRQITQAPMTGTQGPSPGPIGPPSVSKISPSATVVGQDLAQFHEHQHPPTALEDLQARQNMDQTRYVSASINETTNVPVPRPGPIAPPPKAPLSHQTQRPVQYTKSDWQNLPSQLHEADVQAAAKRTEGSQKGIRPAYDPVFRETYKQTVPGDGLGKRRVLRTENIVHDFQTPIAEQPPPELSGNVLPPHALGDSLPPIPHTDDFAATRAIGAEGAQHPPTYASNQIPAPSAAIGGRASRFFPRAQTSPLSDQSDSPPPPPPELQSHPVFDGDAHHPKVNLPVPKAIVKLPPIPPSPPKPVAAPLPPPKFGSQPIVSQSAWQERFNGLFGKHPPSVPEPAPVQAPADTNVLAVNSSTRASLDVPSQQSSATVSLPRGSSLFAVDDSKEKVSKTMAEEDFMEEQEMGSVPTVCLPKRPHLNHHLRPMMAPNSRPQYRFQRPVDVFTAEPMLPSLADCEQNAAGYVISIRLPGAQVTKTRVMRRPQRNRNSSSYRKKRNITPQENGNPASSPRARRPSGTPQSQPGPMQNTAPRPPRPSGSWETRRTGAQGNGWDRRAASGMVN